MNLDAYDFNLPKHLIAQVPAFPRDHARLLVYNRKTKHIHNDYFYNLNQHLHPQTTLVLNNSKVEKARMRFGKIEVFIVETHNDTHISAKVFPGKKFKLDGVVELADGLEARVLDIDEEGLRRLELSKPLSDSVYDQYRLTPLPPYIDQDESLTDEYQTVYAKDLGSKAAPTAGLHFTTELLEGIKQTHPVAELTLHVCLGTFAPLTDDNLQTGTLHKELIELNAVNARILNDAKHRTAVGTTSVRSLESLVSADGKFTAQKTSTQIFIQPVYEYKAVNSLITNFHLPKSSLLMLVAAMTGIEEMQRIYTHAIREEYRFYSFGDAMLIQ